jgi:hypothetical protein
VCPDLFATLPNVFLLVKFEYFFLIIDPTLVVHCRTYATVRQENHVSCKQTFNCDVLNRAIRTIFEQNWHLTLSAGNASDQHLRGPDLPLPLVPVLQDHDQRLRRKVDRLNPAAPASHRRPINRLCSMLTRGYC